MVDKEEDIDDTVVGKEEKGRALVAVDEMLGIGVRIVELHVVVLRGAEEEEVLVVEVAIALGHRPATAIQRPLVLVMRIVELNVVLLHVVLLRGA